MGKKIIKMSCGDVRYFELAMKIIVLMFLFGLVCMFYVKGG